MSMEDTTLRGVILQGVGGFYTALDGEGHTHTLRAQGKLRRERMKPKVGDEIDLIPGKEEEHGWITRIRPRRNQLTRPPVANIDVIVIVAAAASPDPDLVTVDRLMLNARRAGIDVQLVINKCDLAEDRARGIAEQYRGAFVNPLAVSARDGRGLDELRRKLAGRVHALAGQSGAGKSTLINALYGLSQQTGDLSRRIERGKNTTRHCQLIRVEGGGMVLDTPGFSLLETELFDPVEMKLAWPEFAPYEGMCYFQPCYHAAEPRCAVLRGVEEGKIDAQRHERYVALLEEMKMRWRDRYD